MRRRRVAIVAILALTLCLAALCEEGPSPEETPQPVLTAEIDIDAGVILDTSPDPLVPEASAFELAEEALLTLLSEKGEAVIELGPDGAEAPEVVKGEGAEASELAKDGGADESGVTATVTWGDMKFIYDVGAESWMSDGSNAIEVKNNSETDMIRATFEYAPGDNSEPTIGVFSAPVSAWTVGGSNPAPVANIGGGTAYTPDDIPAYTTQTLYVLFTSAGNVDRLTDSYAHVGTLSVSILAV